MLLSYNITFERILQFDCPEAFWPITWDPKYARYVGQISITILGFIIDYFQEKLTWKNFSKKTKNPILGPFWAILPNLGQKWEKRALSVFQCSNYLPLCLKAEKPNEPFLRKLLDRHTKNQFISSISLWDTANFRVLRLIEKSCNLIGQEHFGPYLRNQNFPIRNFLKHARITII